MGEESVNQTSTEVNQTSTEVTQTSTEVNQTSPEVTQTPPEVTQTLPAVDQTPPAVDQKPPKDLQAKILFWQRISAFCVFGIFCTVAIVAMIMVPRVQLTLTEIDEAANEVEGAVAGVNEMIAEVTETSKSINSLVGKNADAMSDAVTKLSSIDYDGLNAAIKDLQDTVGPLASFFGKFK